MTSSIMTQTGGLPYEEGRYLRALESKIIAELRHIDLTAKATGMSGRLNLFYGQIPKKQWEQILSHIETYWPRVGPCFQLAPKVVVSVEMVNFTP
jgi:hypothetical protein